MTEWKKAKKLVECREPEPNAHEFKYLGRTPQGGLSGGDDVYECVLCGETGYGEDENDYCSEAETKGKTEAVVVGQTEYYYHDIKQRAVKGKHIIVKDVDGIRVIEKSVFEKNYELEAKNQ
jgi:hypothetical protein